VFRRYLRLLFVPLVAFNSLLQRAAAMVVAKNAFFFLASVKES
jgi:hypothetical protein